MYLLLVYGYDNVIFFIYNMIYVPTYGFVCGFLRLNGKKKKKSGLLTAYPIDVESAYAGTSGQSYYNTRLFAHST